MKSIKLIVITLILLTGCAQVPKEAVELSATVGRDLSEMKKSHITLVDLYYTELLKDINNFVDNVYLPYQIQRTLADEIWKNEMLSAIESASQVDPTGNTQIEAFKKIEAFLLIIQEEVEDYRKLKLKPVQDQYASVLYSINQSYEQIHYANSIVTGYLASVVKVHDTQNEILEKLDLKNLRVDVGKGIADISDKIGELVQKAKDGEEDLNSIVSKFETLVLVKDINSRNKSNQP
ncbi:MAG: hypothetical protein KAR20_18045 [Candidatus Heimdallarchaeota archaeon]|nr:hypothetical protein [Candidatus Heimdallarchaeota archaeon]